MNKTSKPAAAPAADSIRTIDLVNRSLPRRYRAEKRFRFYGMGAIVLSLLFLSFLFISIAGKGYPAFQKTFIELNIFFDPDVLRQDALATADYSKLVKTSLSQMFPEVTGRRDNRDLYRLVSSGAAFKLRNMVLKDPDVIGQTLPVWVTANDDVDMLIKGRFDRTASEGERRINDNQIAWIEHLEKDNRIEKRFNRTFFTAGDSREPELAGIWGATVGSFLTLIITLVLSFPIGVASAIYLEEFAPKNRWTDLIEVNINNLAAVPSIVFGLLGLAVFLNFFGLPRSAPLVGGLVLTLMTLPTIIIASRASLQSVPPSIREAALGVGASKMQMVAHHVLPLALPGMLTGTIIGMARALGESAPLLMIGMVAFIIETKKEEDMIKKTVLLAASLIIVAALFSGAATAQSARDYISIVGSSTVYPFATVVTEQFGKTTKFKTPKIESTGSGGGFKLFCAGVGTKNPDITNASRAMKKSEFDTCQSKGVKDIIEGKIGYDGIVMANSKKAPALKLTRKDIFLALARDVPDPKGGEKAVANPYRTWKDVNPGLPNVKIEVLGPPPTSGTRDAFVDLVMEPGAEEFGWIKALAKSDKKKFQAISQTVREDGAYVEAGENDNLIVQKLEANPAALGIFGFSFLDQNTDKIQGSYVDGEQPTFENIAAGKYPVSRPLFFYVKKAHVDVIPGMKEYLVEFTSEKAWGKDGYLAEKGLIPMPTAERKKYQEALKTMKPLSM